jgi:hypothetical protein
MVGKLITIFTCAVVTYFLPLLAEKVTVEKILDLSVFGNCNIYLKRFREDQRTIDLTEKLILVQHELRKDYALTCIDNATRILPMASPSVSLFENCVLNVIVGILRRDLMRLIDFMNDNKYTYSSAPFSTYILIPDTFNSKTNVRYPTTALVVLPVRVFYLLVPTLPTDDVSLYTKPYFLICAHCDVSDWEKSFELNSDLAHISSFNFSSSWLSNDVQIVNAFLEGDDVTGCDGAPWGHSASLAGSSENSTCDKFFAFMDVLVRGVEPNFTLSARYKTGFGGDRFSGYLEKVYFNSPRFEHAASAWFLDISDGVLYFCDCNPKSQKEILKAWIKPFGRYVWLGSIVTYIILSLTTAAQLRSRKAKNLNNSPLDYAAPFMTITGLFFRQERKNAQNQGLLVLASFCIGVIITQYENSVTSELVVPPPKLEHNLSSLLMALGSKVVYSGPKPPWNTRLTELLTEAKKWNIRYSKDQFELNNALYVKGTPLENGTSFSYFGFYLPVEIDLRLRMLKLVHNKCHCYIVQHTFSRKEIYITFNLFLRNRFALVSNILRASGITDFFTEKYGRSEGKLLRTRLRRRLEKNEDHSDFFQREERRLDLIKLENLYFILVIFGGMGLLAVNMFIFKEMNWLGLFVHSRAYLFKRRLISEM